jgi:hypothetical protein
MPSAATFRVMLPTSASWTSSSKQQLVAVQEVVQPCTSAPPAPCVQSYKPDLGYGTACLVPCVLTRPGAASANPNSWLITMVP